MCVLAVKAQMIDDSGRWRQCGFGGDQWLHSVPLRCISAYLGWCNHARHPWGVGTPLFLAMARRFLLGGSLRCRILVESHVRAALAYGASLLLTLPGVTGTVSDLVSRPLRIGT